MENEYLVSLVTHKDGIYDLVEKRFAAKDDEHAMTQVYESVKYLATLCKIHEDSIEVIGYPDFKGDWGNIN